MSKEEEDKNGMAREEYESPISKNHGKKLSKFLSYILRHSPGVLNLELDEDGFTTIDLTELARRISEHLRIKIDSRDIEFIVKNDKKGRFEIRNDRIRALHGHSIPVGKTMWLTKPPTPVEKLPRTLYHGTLLKNLDSILQKGILPGKRMMVHLSPTREWALEVSMRRRGIHVILEIDVYKLISMGFNIWKASNSTLLTTKVPPEAIQTIDFPHGISKQIKKKYLKEFVNVK